MNANTTVKTKYYVIETLSYDGECISETDTLAGPFDTVKKAEKAFAEIAEDYDEDDENVNIDEDSCNIVYYEGNGEIHNILIINVPA